MMSIGQALPNESPWAVIVPAVAFVAATGLIVANAVTSALAALPQSAGAASALLGSVQYSGGIVGSAAVGAFATGTPTPMIMTMLAMSAGCVICAWLQPKNGIATRGSEEHP